MAYQAPSPTMNHSGVVLGANNNQNEVNDYPNGANNPNSNRNYSYQNRSNSYPNRVNSYRNTANSNNIRRSRPFRQNQCGQQLPNSNDSRRTSNQINHPRINQPHRRLPTRITLKDFVPSNFCAEPNAESDPVTALPQRQRLVSNNVHANGTQPFVVQQKQ